MDDEDFPTATQLSRARLGDQLYVLTAVTYHLHSEFWDAAGNDLPRQLVEDTDRLIRDLTVPALNVPLQPGQKYAAAIFSTGARSATRAELDKAADLWSCVPNPPDVPAADGMSALLAVLARYLDTGSLAWDTILAELERVTLNDRLHGRVAHILGYALTP